VRLNRRADEVYVIGLVVRRVSWSFGEVQQTQPKFQIENCFRQQQKEAHDCTDHNLEHRLLPDVVFATCSGARRYLLSTVDSAHRMNKPLRLSIHPQPLTQPFPFTSEMNHVPSTGRWLCHHQGPSNRVCMLCQGRAQYLHLARTAPLSRISRISPSRSHLHASSCSCSPDHRTGQTRQVRVENFYKHAIIMKKTFPRPVPYYIAEDLKDMQAACCLSEAKLFRA
jgi:hypothetical protein